MTDKETRRGFTVWLTGLSGSGKSTIAAELGHELRKQNIRRGGSWANITLLDGDLWRASPVARDLGFSKEDRDENIRRAAAVAGWLSQHEIVIAAFISPYEEARRYAWSLSDRFLLVHVDCPLEECERRDPKGLYERVRKGEIKNFTGISDPYNPPLSPHVVCYTKSQDIDDSVKQIISVLNAKGWLEGWL